MSRKDYNFRKGDKVILAETLYDGDCIFKFKKGDRGIVTGLDAFLIQVRMIDFDNYRIAVLPRLLCKVHALTVR